MLAAWSLHNPPTDAKGLSSTSCVWCAFVCARAHVCADAMRACAGLRACAQYSLQGHHIDILVVNCSLFNTTPSLAAMVCRSADCVCGE